jgi:hypothetical protein
VEGQKASMIQKEVKEIKNEHHYVGVFVLAIFMLLFIVAMVLGYHMMISFFFCRLMILP